MSSFEMNSPSSRSQGVALIFALLLLLVLTVIGVGTLSTVSMQERMAGNANLQALAFEAASAGVTETLEQWLDEDNWPAGKTCARGINENWSTNWTAPVALVVPGIPAGFAVQYQTRLGCFEAENWEVLTGSPEPAPQQLLALSRGRVFQANAGMPIDIDDPIAEREVEVRLERRGGGVPDCAINFCQLADMPPSKGVLEMSTSKKFSIDGGEGGCPVGAASGEDADAMKGQLRENQIGQYLPIQPGIVENPLRDAWGNPTELARATNGLKIGIRAYEAWEDWKAFGSAPDVAPLINELEERLNTSLPTQASNNPFGFCRGVLTRGNQTSCPDADEQSFPVHYVAGDIQINGNCTFNSFMVTEGSYIISGNPEYSSSALVLGGTVDVNGWGNADNAGIMVVQNLESAQTADRAKVAYPPDLITNDPDARYSNPVQGRCRFLVDGGGTGFLRLKQCADLQADWIYLNRCLESLAVLTEDLSAPSNWGNAPTFFDYLSGLMGGDTSPIDDPEFVDTEVPDILNPTAGLDEPQFVQFPVPKCGGEADGRRNVIASWREFIDRGRWDNVPIFN